MKLGGKTCDYEGETICNGAVVSETPFSAMACDQGKIKKKGIKGVKGNPRVGKDTGPGKGKVTFKHGKEEKGKKEKTSYS